MAISQTISPITALPTLLSSERPAAVDNLVETELPLFSIQLTLWQSQLNETQTAIKQSENNAKAYQDTSKTYRDQSLTNKDLSLVYKTATESAYNSTQTLVNNLVIPTAATYNAEYIDDIQRREFLNFKIGDN